MHKSFYQGISGGKAQQNLWSVPEAQPVVDALWRKLEEGFAGLYRPVELFPARD